MFCRASATDIIRARPVGRRCRTAPATLVGPHIFAAGLAHMPVMQMCWQIHAHTEKRSHRITLTNHGTSWSIHPAIYFLQFWHLPVAGYINLQLPVFHIGFFKQTLAVLSCICKACSRVLLYESESKKYYKAFRRCVAPNLSAGLQLRTSTL